MRTSIIFFLAGIVYGYITSSKPAETQLRTYEVSARAKLGHCYKAETYYNIQARSASEAKQIASRQMLSTVQITTTSPKEVKR